MSIAIIFLQLLTYIYVGHSGHTVYVYLFQGILGFGTFFTSRELLEVEVKVSLLLGHSGDSILLRKTEVHLCGFL